MPRAAVRVGWRRTASTRTQAGTLRDFYYGYFGLTSLPGVLLGVWLGQKVAQAIDPVSFKQLVLLLCLGLGLKLGLA